VEGGKEGEEMGGREKEIGKRARVWRFLYNI